MSALVLKLRKVRYLGWGIAAVFFALLAAIAGPEEMGALTRSFSWQVVTGSALTVCMIYQWTVFAQRFTKDTKNARQHYNAHRWVGVGATLLFAIHAVRPGHAWMTALAVVFIGIAVTGLLNREVVKYRKQWMYLAWLGMHMCLSAILVPLLAIHIWAALAYQGG
ncbi:MAG: hypothetical protein AAGI10_08925 [Pseudomonadota bacterium]